MTPAARSHSGEGITEPALDLAERGRGRDGGPVRLDRRLFMRLTPLGACTDVRPLVEALRASPIDGVLYEDVNDPRGVALLAFHEDPGYFLGHVAHVLREPPFRDLVPKRELAMLGRSYAIGYESDLEATLLHRPRERVCNPAWPWAIWYPLRRTGSFEQLTIEQQRAVLAEHGGVGRTFAADGYAHDIRLACHGLDTNDNDFLVGLVGPALHPLSVLVQHMRRTAHTAMYLDRIGPFFVGRAIWQADQP